MDKNAIEKAEELLQYWVWNADRDAREGRNGPSLDTASKWAMIVIALRGKD